MKPQTVYRIKMPNARYSFLPLGLAVEFERHLQRVAQRKIKKHRRLPIDSTEPSDNLLFEKDGYRILYAFDESDDTIVIQSVVRVLM